LKIRKRRVVQIRTDVLMYRLPLMTGQIVSGRFYSFNKKKMEGVDRYR
jgi:hypothetical protein